MKLFKDFLSYFDKFRSAGEDHDGYKELLERMTNKYRELDEPQNSARVSNWEKTGLRAIRSDLENNRGLGYAGSHAKLAWLWVEREEERINAQQNAAQEQNRKQQESFISTLKRSSKEMLAKAVILLPLFLIVFILGGLFGKDIKEALLKFVEHL